MDNTTKMFGGIGYIVLIVFGFLGGIMAPLNIITLAAAICVLIAFIRASHELGRPEIKSRAITALVLYIIAAVLLIFLVGAGVVAYFLHRGSVGAAVGLGAGVVVGGIIGWILSIVAAWFWYKASIPLTETTGIGLYRTGGLLIFIGAILLVVFGLGTILILIGDILQCIAFFTTPEKIEAPPAAAA